MGSVGGEMPKRALEKLYLLGRAITEKDCVLVIGGCPGLLFADSKGAKDAGDFTR